MTFLLCAEVQQVKNRYVGSLIFGIKFLLKLWQNPPPVLGKLEANAVNPECHDPEEALRYWE